MNDVVPLLPPQNPAAIELRLAVFEDPSFPGYRIVLEERSEKHTSHVRITEYLAVRFAPYEPPVSDILAALDKEEASLAHYNELRFAEIQAARRKLTGDSA